MAKRKFIETSVDAYRGLDPNKMSETYVAIVESLKLMGEGNYQDIAQCSEMPEARVWKRIGEVMKMGLIHDTGKTKKTTHGNKSRIYALGPSAENVEHKKRVLKGKTVVDYSKAILKQPKPNQQNIERLF
jgi:predicted transcriptional regulator